MKIIKETLNYIRSHNMLQKGDKALVCVSGGTDSMALLLILDALREELGIELAVVHLHHGLRVQEADQEAKWVEEQAGIRHFPFYCRQTDVAAIAGKTGRSLEDAARRERYAFFMEIREKTGADKIALGHHLHDQAETVLLNFLRGTGSRGLRGMQPMRGGLFIRPLLATPKEDILLFLKEKGVSSCQDQTNQSPLFLRNRVRLDLIPYLQGYNGRITERLGRMADIMRMENDFLEQQVQAIFLQWGLQPDAAEITIDLLSFSHLHEAMQRRVIKTLLERKCAERNGVGQVHIEAVWNLCRAGHAGQSLDLPWGTRVVRRYGNIILSSPEERRMGEQKSHDFSYPVPHHDCEIYISETGQTIRFTLLKGDIVPNFSRPHIAYLDYDALRLPLMVRNARPGDRFHPLGSPGKKKLKSFFIDRKVLREERSRILLVADQDDIVWIGAIASAEKIRVAPATENYLKIEII
ncbi:MAG: tRNA lysidine(34) synthetase TilS [Syntrophobacterales bacterium]|jgi:tRNA(Ile)-lysidine synthase|nr:tRNA lysidine(34) synthetase TilS [Syntrophobacterales bacterium]